MSASYQFYAIPIEVTTHSADLRFELICNVVFDPGTYTSDQITAAITGNPLWNAISRNELETWIAPFQAWRDSVPRRAKLLGSPQLQTKKCTIAAAPNQAGADELRRRMRDFFGASGTAAAPSSSDVAREIRKSADLVDLNRAVHSMHQSMHNLLLRSSQRFSRHLTYSSGFAGISMPFLRWIDTASRAAILEKVYSEPLPSDDHIAALRDTADKIKLRAAVTTQAVRSGLYRNGQKSPVDATDLNAAVHALMRESYLAQYLGFRTSWVAQGLALPNGTYLIQPSDSFYPGNPEPKNVPPVVFFRGSQTHPIAFNDVASEASSSVKPGNGLFVKLNRGDTPSYSTACVETEAQLTRDLTLQGSNSLAAPANKPKPGNEIQENPNLLKHQRAGSSEPKTSGIQFSAPAADLVFPLDLVAGGSRDAARTTWPCLFLDDLWIGYRLDIRRKDGTKFLSIHREQKYYTLSGDQTVPNAGASSPAWVEDFIERNQQDAGAGKASSTNLFTYNGFCAQQMENYKRVLDLPSPNPNLIVHSFRSTVTDFKASEPLLFDGDYEYRLRTVFICGIGAPFDVPPDALDSSYRQAFSFLRAHTFRAGELLRAITGSPEQDADGSTVYLTRQKDTQSLFLLPSPIDLETARYHGLLFQSTSELTELDERLVISDLGKFANETGYTSTNYFLDPQVSSVVVRLSMVNGDLQDEAETVQGPGGTVHHIRRHVDLPPIEMRFGEDGHWKKFRPIELRFQALRGEATAPSIKVQGQRLLVYVPPAAEIHVSIIPSIASKSIVRTASVAPTAWQYGISRAPEIEPSNLPIPVNAIAETTAKVIFATKMPLLTPVIKSIETYPFVGESRAEIVLGVRSPRGTLATPHLRIDLDAGSSKEVYLEAKWMDIDGSPSSSAPAHKPGSGRSQARSIVFRPVDAYEPTPAALAHYLGDAPNSQAFPLALEEQFHRQQSEDTVFSVGTDVSATAPTNATPTGTALAIDFADLRRKWGRVSAAAVSRFADYFGGPADDFTAHSSSLLLDVPSAMALSAPQIQSIRHLKAIENTNTAGAARRRSSFALRIYLSGNPFTSGIGQRLAIGFAAGEFSAIDTQSHEMVSYATLWGEDPIERPRLEVSRRYPRASDFGSPYDDSSALDLDAFCYPPDAVGGDQPVIYRDNLELDTAAGGTTHWVSIASYALTFDPHQRLWYCDVVTTTGFRGWMRLALYAHQPHAVQGSEISQAATCLYASSLGDEVITWRQAFGRIFVSAGPFDDPNLDFELDAVRYRASGISEPLTDDPSTVKLKKVQVGHAVYFEGNVPDGKSWNWVKLRFGAIIDSGAITL